MNDALPQEPVPLSPYMLGHQAAERERAGERVPCPFHPGSEAAIDWLLGISDGEDGD